MDTQLPNAFLTGNLIYLRPFEKEDLPYMRQWSSDPELRGLTGEVRPVTVTESEHWFERMCNDPERIWFVIVEKESGRPVGECGLLRMFYAWRTTDLTMIIGEKEARGKGYGKEAINLLLDYAFGYLNFHRISIGVVGFNQNALRFYEKVGFRQEGIQREGYFHNHQYSDFVMMSILEEEWRTRKTSAGIEL